MTAEREALALAKSAIGRLEQAVSLLDDTFFYTEGYHKSIVEFTDRFAKIDQALANPATIRDTDEDAEVRLAELRHWFFQKLNPEQRKGFLFASGIAPRTCDFTPEMQYKAIRIIAARLASSTPAEPDEPTEAMRELDMHISALNAAHEAMQSINQNNEAHELYIKLEGLEEFRQVLKAAMSQRKAEPDERLALAKQHFRELKGGDDELELPPGFEP